MFKADIFYIPQLINSTWQEYQSVLAKEISGLLGVCIDQLLVEKIFSAVGELDFLANPFIKSSFFRSLSRYKNHCPFFPEELQHAEKLINCFNSSSYNSKPLVFRRVYIPETMPATPHSSEAFFTPEHDTKMFSTLLSLAEIIYSLGYRIIRTDGMHCGLGFHNLSCRDSRNNDCSGRGANPKHQQSFHTDGLGYMSMEGLKNKTPSAAAIFILRNHEQVPTDFIDLKTLLNFFTFKEIQVLQYENITFSSGKILDGDEKNIYSPALKLKDDGNIEFFHFTTDRSRLKFSEDSNLIKYIYQKIEDICNVASDNKIISKASLATYYKKFLVKKYPELLEQTTVDTYVDMFFSLTLQQGDLMIIPNQGENVLAHRRSGWWQSIMSFDFTMSDMGRWAIRMHLADVNNEYEDKINLIDPGIALREVRRERPFKLRMHPTSETMYVTGCRDRALSAFRQSYEISLLQLVI